MALRSRLQKRYADDPQTALVEELGICQGRTRIDLAVVNGVIHGYEIKSDRDSLRRLSSQVEVYGRVVDRATLVVGRRHLTQSLGSIPAWWGVLQVESVSGAIRFTTIRDGHKNPQIEARSLVELLWFDDAIDLLARRGAARGVRGKPRRVVWDRICERIELREISDAVRARLRARAVLQDLAQPW